MRLTSTLFKQNDDFDEDEVNRIRENSERLKNSLTTCSAWILAHNNATKETAQTSQEKTESSHSQQKPKNLNTDIVNMDIVDMNEGDSSSKQI